jgi:hypothetical protein
MHAVGITVRIILLLVLSLEYGHSLTAHASHTQAQVALGRPPQQQLDNLIGPLTGLGVPKGWKMYDLDQLNQGRRYAEGFPAVPGDLISSNFYDLAYTLYQIYYRTHDTYWRTQAREVATQWKNSYNIQALHTCVEQTDGPFNYDKCAPILAARNQALGGVAVLGLESGDAEARALLDLYARFIKLKNDQSFWDDPRENGYKLMYLTAAVAMGYDHRALVKTLLDTSLAHQRADGSWAIQATYQGCSYQYPENFMLGLLMEGLILYDRVIGDPRILPAVRKTADWLWATQWNASLLAFRYSPPQAEACIPGDPRTHVLSGLYLPGWGYLYEQTGDAKYKTQGDQILRGLVSSGMPGTGNAKFFNQVFRSSSQYLGYLTTP